MLQPKTHPEVEKLRAECAALRVRLKDTIEEYVRLTSEEHQRLMHIYDVNFGAVERTRQQLTLACAELFRRVELLSIKVARGETITPQIVILINKVVDKEYERLYQRLRDASRLDRERRESTAGDYGNSDGTASGGSGNPANDAELAAMYRALAKRLHPDAVDDEDGRLERRRDWDRVQDAYRRRNIPRLRSLLATMPGADEELRAEGSLEKLQTEVASLETRLRIEKRRLTRLQTQEPFSIAAELHNEQWRNRHKRELEHAVEVKRKELEQHRLQYIDLAKSEVPLHTPVPGSDKDFDSDFMDNTYFGAR